MPVLTLKVPDDQMAEITAAAEAAGVSRSAFVRDAALAMARGVLDPRRPLPTASEPPPVARAQVRAEPVASCKHPANRRIGRFCAACGRTL